MPAVTCPGTEHHRPLAGTKLYCLVTESHRCEQLAQGCYAAFAPSRIWIHDLLITSPALYPLRHTTLGNINVVLDKTVRQHTIHVRRSSSFSMKLWNWGTALSPPSFTYWATWLLHWIPVDYQIQFKIATLTYQTLATCQLSYLYSLLQVHQLSRALRSSSQQFSNYHTY